MTTKQQMIIGIKADVEDVNTGVPASFHIISGVHLDLTNKYYTATVDSYYNQDLYDKGKRALGSVSFSLSEDPPRGVDVIDWALTSLVDSDNPNPHQFTGAELVKADLSE
ncbi:hypothetical protein CRG49_000540 [Neisseria sp. N95_16]|uniref:Uncharacterized protein n=1 Tax=Neisseria brasiliensis TaxID=2666100 RepID=A0A7X2GZL8_9NEIS|nr:MULTISPECIES: hypothetical protein [Neisseria]MRN38619.1 hypothetical protein [Neisseria brasiliensis]PJO10741.1 hypothetical protein CRG49_000540 [Neisseria sp. N95_16]